MKQNLAAEPGLQLAQKIFAVAKIKREEEKNDPDKKTWISMADICSCRELKDVMACNKSCANFGA